MPHVINGVGTWYVGKGKLFSRMGTCPNCHGFTQLETYETFNAFVILYIPVFPLGRVKVIEQCSHCKRHQRLPLKQWELVKAESIKEARELAAKAGEDRANALAIVQIAFSLHDPATFAELVPLVEKQAEGDAEILEAISDGYFRYGFDAEGITALKKAARLADNSELYEKLGMRQLSCGNPDEGWPLVKHFLTSPRRDPIGTLYLAVESYLATGRADEASQILDQIASAYPGSAGEKDFKRYRRSVDAARRTGRPILSTVVRAHGVGKPIKGDIRGRWLFFLWPSLAMLGFLAYAIHAYNVGRSCDVRLVSGLTRPCVMTINGEEYKVAAYGERTVNVPTGDVTVTVKGAGLRIPDQTVHIERNWFTAPFDNTARVINPDRVSVLVREEMEYVPVSSMSGRESRYSIWQGQNYYEFPDVDYAFETPPSSIKLARDKSVTKVHVSQYDQHDAAHRIQLVVSEVGPEEGMAMAVRGFDAEPDNATYLELKMMTLPPQEASNFLRPYLNERPVMINAHLQYLDRRRKTESLEELRAEYKGFLEKEPENEALKYLLACVTTKAEESERLLKEALSSKEAGPHAGLHLGLALASRGEFAEALETLDHTFPLESLKEQIDAARVECYSALGRHQDGLNLLRGNMNTAQSNYFSAYAEVYLTQMAAGADAARETIRAWRSKLRDAGSAPTEVSQFEQAATAQLDYVAGDSKAYIESAEKPEEADPIALVLAGRYEDAIDHGDMQSSSEQGNVRLMASLACHLKGDASKSRKFLRSACRAYKTGDYEHRMAAAWLSRSRTPGAGDIAGLYLPTVDKRLITASLAVQLPERREECLSVLRKLNYDHRPPFLMLSTVCETVAGADAGS